MFGLFFSLLVSLSALAAPEVVAPAPLVLQGHALFTFKTRIGSIQPAERVKLISARLERLVDDRTFDLNKITVHEDATIGWEIFAGDTLLLVITPEDARAEHRSGKLLAEAVAFRLKEILAEDRRMKSPREVLIQSMYALLYTLGLIALLVGVSWGSRRLKQNIETWQGTVIPSIRVKNLEILPAERIAQFALWGLTVGRLLITVTLLYFFIPLVLGLFPWTSQYSALLLGYLVTPLRQMFHAIVAFIPNLFFIVLYVLATRYVLKLIRLVFSEIERGTLQFAGFYPEWAEPTYQLVRLLAIAFSVVVLFPYLPGSSSPAFQGVSVFIGVIVSFGSTSAMANIIAGLVLTYMRSFRLGDRVKIGETMGDIIEKSLLVTRVRTVKNVDITIPNSVVLNSHIINFSSEALAQGLILHTEVTIGYDAPWRKVHALLIEAARKTEGVLATPAPFVLQTGLDDSYVRYEINVYTRQANGMASIYSALRQNIQDAFNEAGVEILSPSYSALRDGNTVTIPEEKRPAHYEAPSFRVSDPRRESPEIPARPAPPTLDA